MSKKPLKAVVWVWGHIPETNRYKEVRILFADLIQRCLCSQKVLGIDTPDRVKTLFPLAFVSDDSVVVQVRLIGVELVETLTLSEALESGLLAAALALKEAGNLCRVPDVYTPIA